MSTSMRRTVLKVVVITLVVTSLIAAVFLFILPLLRNGSNTPSVGPGAGTTADTMSGQSAALPVPIAKAYPSAPSGPTLAIGTPYGSVSVKNFYATSPGVVDEGNVVVAEGDGYTITYDPLRSSFSILVATGSFNEGRPAAEAAFLSALGVSENDACKLSVSETVPYDSSNPSSGRAYPLSFCIQGAQP